MAEPFLRNVDEPASSAGRRTESPGRRAGEIHAVLGENGAGKSTLMKIIYGAVRPDAGRLEWEGEPVTIGSPGEARALGIAMVYQHFALFESVSVVENMALALPGAFDLRALAARISEVSERYGLPLNPWRPVHELSVGERQRVEIVRCLLQSPKLLIMDEPTSVLTPQAVDQLFETLRKLAAEGTAIVYISHKLDEIRRLCQRATILRGGRFVAEVDPRLETEHRLAEMMIGRDFPRTQRTEHRTGDVVLELIGLSVPAEGPFGVALDQVSLRLHRGEVLGIAGISGNGQAELLAAISGEVAAPDPQTVWLAGAHGEAHAVDRDDRRIGLADLVQRQQRGGGHGRGFQSIAGRDPLPGKQSLCHVGLHARASTEPLRMRTRRRETVRTAPFRVIGSRARGSRGRQPSRSRSTRATTFVARRRSSSSTCSSARLALLSSTVRGPAP